MESFDLEALGLGRLGQFLSEHQQELLLPGLIVAGLLLLWIVVRVVRRPGKTVPSPDSGEQVPSAGEVVEEAEVAEEAATDVDEEDVDEPDFVSLAERFKRGLSKTRQNFTSLFVAGQRVDEDVLEDLETHLLMADVGMETTQQVLDELAGRIKKGGVDDQESLQQVLKQILLDLLKPCEQPAPEAENKPQVILMVGVNGVGKTTTIGKLAKRFQIEGKSVMLAAGDTFRAAAVEQLQTWGERNNVPVVAQHTGADSASVIFDAIQSAQAKGVDVVIADTAGRLHNKDNLMEELKKVTRVMKKLDESAPHEVLLVLDAATGQNALAQMREFQSAVGVTGVVLTKLDGTAKGGVIFPLCNRFQTPVRFVGVGEGIDDLQPFAAKAFVDALFEG